MVPEAGAALRQSCGLGPYAPTVQHSTLYASHVTCAFDPTQTVESPGNVQPMSSPCLTGSVSKPSSFVHFPVLLPATMLHEVTTARKRRMCSITHSFWLVPCHPALSARHPPDLSIP